MEGKEEERDRRGYGKRLKEVREIGEMGRGGGERRKRDGNRRRMLEGEWRGGEGKRGRKGDIGRDRGGRKEREGGK